MKNFMRVVRLALKYKVTLATSVVCSLFIALLWGLNFGTVYPFVQIIFKGESMQQWVDGQIVDAEENLAEINEEIERLESGPQDSTEEEAHASETALRKAQLRKNSETKALATYRQLQGPIHRFLPDDPFKTLLVVVAFFDAEDILNRLFGLFDAEPSGGDLIAARCLIAVLFLSSILWMDRMRRETRKTD